MAAHDPQLRRRIASLGADVSWARTPNRSERTAPGYAASPVSYAYHLAKVTAEGKIRPEDIPAAAASAHRAYMKSLSLKAAAKAADRRQTKTSRRTAAA